MLNTHLYLSVLAGVFIFIFGITGCIMAFENELEHILHAKLYKVKPNGSPQSFGSLTQRLDSLYPGDTISLVNGSTVPDIAYQVYYPGKKVCINQYTGEILGVEYEEDKWSAALRIIHQLHLRLAFRDSHDTGKSIMSWAGLSMTIILITGIILWWKQKTIRIDFKSSSKRLWYDSHQLAGFAFFLLLLTISVTGTIIGFEKSVMPLAYSITGSAPNKFPNPKVEEVPGVKMISLDSAMAIAQTLIPGATPFSVNVPQPGDAYVVRLRYPEDITVGGRSRVVINPYTTDVLFAEGSRTAPMGTRLLNINRTIHTGDVLGKVGKLVASLISIVAAFQLVSGFTVWFKKKSTKTVN